MKEEKDIIEKAFLDINSFEKAEIKNAVDAVFTKLNTFELKIADVKDGNVIVHEWIKKAILLKFRTSENQIMPSGIESYNYFDKVELKFANWSEDDFKNAKIRAVPGAIVRNGCFIGQNVVLMPCFVNVGASIGDGTMIDTWSTVGSCAQIGKNCHISGGVGIGGVLEPLQANPVIIGDNCFIGARSEIAEGVIVGENSVIGMGTFISSSTKIVVRETGEILYGKVPSGSVVVSGIMPHESGISTRVAIIIKQIDEKVRTKTSINELLRG
ncbi:2,3,4,5-tetrahydropyridine-2,6-dicarboxylate N-succinyltransferase [Candidatus Deianiraea vastatrix]|uniref:2,3,4,5-tetrahydropyridine-2,6-dicarboxylate N-succinyltransferase n=1 Tax=Candidatus Deianiraea vastatrix TaxID=2163644 RepID=A0A5B8XFM6_9RICK|nr:2,3,4,5-tetrahydropyridine-2,6-dicarboxylate N-succinyltransferase [Candidatus Deianiraea vastatrix]QED23756.1 2,3,4,5-tetrahydropyridine-2,6-dicarboxylate N-succinyltransferase [Candidatus Deianiraea vastatrix]